MELQLEKRYQDYEVERERTCLTIHFNGTFSTADEIRENIETIKEFMGTLWVEFEKRYNQYYFELRYANSDDQLLRVIMFIKHGCKKEVYSELAGCEMSVEEKQFTYDSWSCAIK